MTTVLQFIIKIKVTNTLEGLVMHDACKTNVDKDKDKNGIPDQLDNCPYVSNPEQLNKNKDFFTNVKFNSCKKALYLHTF